MWRFLDPRGEGRSILGLVRFTIYRCGGGWIAREREREIYTVLGYLKKNGKEVTGTREEYFEISLRVENKIIVSETVII